MQCKGTQGWIKLYLAITFGVVASGEMNRRSLRKDVQQPQME